MRSGGSRRAIFVSVCWLAVSAAAAGAQETMDKASVLDVLRTESQKEFCASGSAFRSCLPRLSDEQCNAAYEDYLSKCSAIVARAYPATLDRDGAKKLAGQLTGCVGYAFGLQAKDRAAMDECLKKSGDAR